MNTASLLTKEGYDFSFNPSACEDCGGKCCIGESGYVFLNIAEMEAIAAFLGESFEGFTLKYVRKVGYKFSLIEKPQKSCERSFACVFYDEEHKNCSIYEVRPSQCVRFPFWEAHRLLDEASMGQLCKECKGIVPHSEQSPQNLAPAHSEPQASQNLATHSPKSHDTSKSHNTREHI